MRERGGIGRLAGLVGLGLAFAWGGAVRADSPWLYGVHFWGLRGGEPVDSGPAELLQCPTYGGWSVEVVLTHSDPWWRAAYFVPGYQDLYTHKNVSLLTRIDYVWGQTVPSPTSPDHGGWPAAVVQTVNQLAPYAHLWIIGNEPNLIDEGQGWPDNRVTPAGYAAIYRSVRAAIHSQAQASPAGPHRVLIAPPSPGGVWLPQRWMAGAEWLQQVIQSIPADEIDGFAIHAYGGPLADFRQTYIEQLAVIGGEGLQDRPVYMTEWNRYASPGNTHEEALAAQFLRDAFADVHAWNETPGNQNIICMAWFVYDGGDGSGPWDGYSLEYWKGAGNPPGSTGDLYTAYGDAVAMRYPAGAIGTPAIQPPVAAFTAEPVAGVAPFAVQFTDGSTGPIGSRLWSFGDGSISTATHPLWTYTQPGAYTVTLVVTGPGGSDMATRTRYVSVLAPELCSGQRIAPFEGYAPDAQVMFRPPRTSGSTSGHLAASPNSAVTTDAVEAFDGNRVLKVQWAFVDDAPHRWLRLTTNDGAWIPNPAIDLRRPIRVRLRLDAGSFRLCAGIRETGVDVPIGADGGTVGPIEWLGADSVQSGAPQGVLVTAQPGVWQTFTFTPTADPVQGFTGDGVLAAAQHRGVLEHLAFSSVGEAGPFIVYLDAIEQVCPPKQDLDLDGDVDLDDFGIFQRCLSGPFVSQTDPACVNARLDGDPDVDYADLVSFRRCLGIADVWLDPDCGTHAHGD